MKVETDEVKSILETPLAAENHEVGATDSQTLTITCRTVPDRISLEYCRFLMPDGTGIHIGDEITQQKYGFILFSDSQLSTSLIHTLLSVLWYSTVQVTGSVA